MRLITLAVLLSASTLVGVQAVSTTSTPAFPLAAGQYWQMSYQLTGQKLRTVNLKLEAEADNSPDEQGGRYFQARDGEAVVGAYPGEAYLIAGIWQPTVFCVVERGKGNTHTGYPLTGTTEELLALLLPGGVIESSPTTRNTGADLYATAKKANRGTCTLKQLR